METQNREVQRNPPFQCPTGASDEGGWIRRGQAQPFESGSEASARRSNSIWSEHPTAMAILEGIRAVRRRRKLNFDGVNGGGGEGRVAGVETWINKWNGSGVEWMEGKGME